MVAALRLRGVCGVGRPAHNMSHFVAAEEILVAFAYRGLKPTAIGNRRDAALAKQWQARCLPHSAASWQLALRMGDITTERDGYMALRLSAISKTRRNFRPVFRADCNGY
jgi:hypothetical protein